MTLKVYSDEEIEEKMQIIAEEYDEEMAKIFYVQAKIDQKAHERRVNKLFRNLKRCIKCEYSTLVYDDELNPIKIDCSKGHTLLDMAQDYCIIEEPF